eukprot:m.201573 g.201573  ORF g.201573 m.201573 type:complete len:586 (-) comp32801_c1_seq1:938-2695(-)
MLQVLLLFACMLSSGLSSTQCGHVPTWASRQSSNSSEWGTIAQILSTPITNKAMIVMESNGETDDVANTVYEINVETGLKLQIPSNRRFPRSTVIAVDHVSGDLYVVSSVCAASCISNQIYKFKRSSLSLSTTATKVLPGFSTHLTPGTSTPWVDVASRKSGGFFALSEVAGSTHTTMHAVEMRNSIVVTYPLKLSGVVLTGFGLDRLSDIVELTNGDVVFKTRDHQVFMFTPSFTSVATPSSVGISHNMRKLLPGRLTPTLGPMSLMIDATDVVYVSNVKYNNAVTIAKLEGLSLSKGETPTVDYFGISTSEYGHAVVGEENSHVVLYAFVNDTVAPRMVMFLNPASAERELIPFVSDFNDTRIVAANFDGSICFSVDLENTSNHEVHCASSRACGGRYFCFTNSSGHQECTWKRECTHDELPGSGLHDCVVTLEDPTIPTGEYYRCDPAECQYKISRYYYEYSYTQGVCAANTPLDRVVQNSIKSEVEDVWFGTYKCNDNTDDRYCPKSLAPFSQSALYSVDNTNRFAAFEPRPCGEEGKNISKCVETGSCSCTSVVRSKAKKKSALGQRRLEIITSTMVNHQ